MDRQKIHSIVKVNLTEESEPEDRVGGGSRTQTDGQIEISLYCKSKSNQGRKCRGQTDRVWEGLCNYDRKPISEVLKTDVLVRKLDRSGWGGGGDCRQIEETDQSSK